MNDQPNPRYHHTFKGEDYCVHGNKLSFDCGGCAPLSQTEREDWREKFDKFAKNLIIADSGGENPRNVYLVGIEGEALESLKTFIDRLLTEERAKVLLEAAEVLHTYAMKTKTTADLDLIEQMQRDILGRLKRHTL